MKNRAGARHMARAWHINNTDGVHGVVWGTRGVACNGFEVDHKGGMSGRAKRCETKRAHYIHKGIRRCQNKVQTMLAYQRRL
jgi:hypothetical protein